MPKNYAAEQNEWSYLIEADTVSVEPRTHTFKADEQELIDIARRLAIVSVEEAEATVTVQRSGGMIHAMGLLKASITQSCTISLIPVPARIEDEFDGWYSDKNKAVSFAKARSDRDAKKSQMESEILEESVDPEPIINGKIDLGELATQYLSLALDPYPRADGVINVFEAAPPENNGDDSGKAIRKNPFEALKDWKEKR